MKLFKQAAAGERGQALLEMLIVLPLFLFLSGAIIGIGWAYWTRLNHTAYAQDATVMAGKMHAPAGGESFAARFMRAGNVDLAGHTAIYWVQPRRAVGAQAAYQGPALLLYDLAAPEIETGAFFRWEQFYPGPGDVFE